jgi:hypothetical protein
VTGNEKGPRHKKLARAKQNRIGNGTILPQIALAQSSNAHLGRISHHDSQGWPTGCRVTEITGLIRVEMLANYTSHPTRAEMTLHPNSAKEVKVVKMPTWLFTETDPKVVAYMPSIQRRKAK